MFEVIAPGLDATIQDMGRPGQRHLGIPQSGAADRLSFAIANHLAGNKWTAPAIEITMGGLTLQARRSARIAISGADMGAVYDDKLAPHSAAFDIGAGDVIRFGFTQSGARSYLSIAGGFDGELFAGSRATYAPARIGGVKGRAFKAGDRIKSASNTAHQAEQATNNLPSHLSPVLANAMVLRVQKGPEFDSYLTPETQRRLFASSFEAGPLSNRMGNRLEPQNIETGALELSNKAPMTSGPLLPGTVQITPNGTPIICGIDAQCTGGYARALSVIPADHWLLGQIAPGVRINFRRVTTKAAISALNLRNKIYSEFIPDFRFD